MLALRDGRTTYADARELEVSPNLWSGVGLVRGGAGTALVGSHEEVADRLADHHATGIDEVILSGYPHVEEAMELLRGRDARPAAARPVRYVRVGRAGPAGHRRADRGVVGRSCGARRLSSCT